MGLATIFGVNLGRIPYFPPKKGIEGEYCFTPIITLHSHLQDKEGLAWLLTKFLKFLHRERERDRERQRERDRERESILQQHNSVRAHSVKQKVEFS